MLTKEKLQGMTLRVERVDLPDGEFAFVRQLSALEELVATKTLDPESDDMAKVRRQCEWIARTLCDETGTLLLDCANGDIETLAAAPGSVTRPLFEAALRVNNWLKPRDDQPGN